MATKSNGKYHINYKDGWAYLTIEAPQGGGRPVYSETVSGRLQLLKIPPVRRQIIQEIIDNASGKPKKLIHWPDGDKLGPEVRVTITENAMTASVYITPEKQGGEPLSKAKIREALTEEGITFGINENAINLIIKNRTYSQSVIIAEGQLPINEKAARVEYHFETDRGKPFRELEYQRIDLKELNFIQNKNEDDLLAKLLPAVPPRNGTDVRGNSLPAETGGDETTLQIGDGAKFSEDGKEILAAVTGNVKLQKGMVTVEPLITVENVDYSNGNMKFEGSIDIQGRIADGFVVNAVGDIQIGKSVSKVEIETKGDLILKAGISGNDGSKITCGGDLYARYIESADIYCAGNLYIEEAIMHSRVMVEKEIILTGKRAEIFGGRVVAGGSIHCKKLGNISEPATELHLGLNLNEFQKNKELESSIAEANAKIDKTDLQLRQIKAALKKGHPVELEGEKPLSIPLEKLSTAKAQLEAITVKLNVKVSEDLRALHEMIREQNIDENAHLTVEQQIFGNVMVFFGALKWHSPEKGTRKTALLVKGGKLLEKGQE